MTKSHASHKATMADSIIAMAEHGLGGTAENPKEPYLLDTMEKVADFCKLYAATFGITTEYAIQLVKEVVDQS